MAKLTTIFTSLNLQELYIAQGILDSEGVETFIKNELINQTVPYLNMNNLIELQVRDQQIDEAVLILQNAGYLKPVISKKKSQIKETIIFIICLLVLLFILVKSGLLKA